MSLESHLALMPVVGTIEPWQAPARRRARTHTLALGVNREQMNAQSFVALNQQPFSYYS
jgi:hypothetical protein